LLTFFYNICCASPAAHAVEVNTEEAPAIFWLQTTS
jgi:hypothetical protein